MQSLIIKYRRQWVTMINKTLHISSPSFNVTKIYPNSVLLESCDQCQVGNEFHTSLGDMSPADLLKIAVTFKEINFLPNEFDFESDIYHETMCVLTFLSHSRTINNFNPVTAERFLDVDVDTRIPDATLWVFGCSHSHGVGLQENELRYSDLMSQELQIPVRLVSKPGSSTQWSLRHLINANFAPGDVVVWQLTTPNRFTWASPTLTEVQLSYCSNRSLVDLWDEKQTLFYQLSLLNTGVRYLRSQPVRFVLTSINQPGPMFYQYIREYVKYPEYCYIPDLVQDLGDDKLHMGPLSHKALAFSLLNHLKCLND